MITDLLLPEGRIVERLTERLPASIRILTAVDLDGIKEGSVPSPSVQVICHGDTAVSAKAAGRSSQITQLWGAVVCVRNVAGIRDGAAARSEAGPILIQVMQALMGWSPATGWSALEQTRSPYRPTYIKGQWYYPLAYQTTVEIRSNNP